MENEITRKYRAIKRECYLRSTPSVDLDLVSESNPINCCDYKLAETDLDAIYAEYGVNENPDLRMAVNMWILFSGPSIKRNK